MESVESAWGVCKNGGQTQTQTQTRRCKHCGVQKTPQWREGPLGPKTLCNACGVRFKSGRLLPEYRPACSPTFSSELHSNHHRIVIEMRRKKETSIDAAEPGLNQPVQEIESVELALKNSVRKEKAVTGGSTRNGDGFSLGDLLDFSNDDVLVEEQGKRGGVSVSLSDGNTLNRSNGYSSVVEDFESLLTSGLSIPMDDLAGIEWLPDFVDDSLKPYSALTKKPNWLTGNRRRRLVEHVKHESCLKTTVPVGSRSKRARNGVSVWSLGSTTTSLSSSGPGAEFLELAVNTQKKQESSLMSAVSINGDQTQSQTRRCSNCGVQETPKWRWRRGALPETKLLCNACGLRPGRSVPACIPVFSSELPSNHHHKVIGMRQKKEEAVTGGAQNGDGFYFDDLLLDISNDNAFVEVEVKYEDEAGLKALPKREASVSRNDETTLHRSNDISSAVEHVGSLPTSEVSVPAMDVAERLSDSLKPMKKRILLTGNRRHLVAPLVNEDSCFKTTLPVEIRSKRDQTGVIKVSVVPLGLPSLTDSTLSSTTSSLSSSGPSNAPLVSGAECLEPAVKRQKKKKKKSPSVCGNGGKTQTQTRQCTHCGTQRTPQWRRGKLPELKLLCNACGVRLDSGRLLSPEYRPACSPTFSSELHSNFHSRVIKIRGKKDADEPGSNQPV